MIMDDSCMLSEGTKLKLNLVSLCRQEVEFTRAVLQDHPLPHCFTG